MEAHNFFFFFCNLHCIYVLFFFIYNKIQIRLPLEKTKTKKSPQTCTIMFAKNNAD